MFAHVAVLGAGGWGTALANVLAQPHREVLLWARRPELAASIEERRENTAYLPGVKVADAIRVTTDLGEVARADLILAAVPAQQMRAVLKSLPPVRAGVPVVICAKGMEQGSGALMSDVVSACLPGQVPAALSGPSFASDVARGRPTAVTVAAVDEQLARQLAQALGRPAFRLYHSTDLHGVEIGGAAKNVLAIACGIAAGLEVGDSASAALVARGFAELARFGRAQGARPETMMGLSGLGDLVLTCSSPQSRNFAFGRALGAGASLREALGGRLVEGVSTAATLVERARASGVEMPVAEAVASILSGAIEPGTAVDLLLSRPSGAETC